MNVCGIEECHVCMNDRNAMNFCDVLLLYFYLFLSLFIKKIHYHKHDNISSVKNHRHPSNINKSARTKLSHLTTSPKTIPALNNLRSSRNCLHFHHLRTAALVIVSELACVLFLLAGN
jgi:hypothetical protein